MLRLANEITESSGRGRLKIPLDARLVWGSMEISGEDVDTRPLRANLRYPVLPSTGYLRSLLKTLKEAKDAYLPKDL
jgi:hypothetical protein